MTLWELGAQAWRGFAAPSLAHSLGISAASGRSLLEGERPPWSRNKPSGWGPLDQASTILQACEWGRHRPPSPGTWQLDAAAWACTSLTSPDAHHLHQCKLLLLVIIGSKDFIHIAINVFPICYELSRLWKVGFGNAFHVLNHPLRDKLLE